MEFLTIFFIMAFIVIVAVWLMVTIPKNRIAKMESALEGISDFTASQSVMGVDGFTGLAIDKEKGMICLLVKTKESVDHYVIPYSDLLSSEVIVDGNTVTQTSRTSQLGGALLGGLALGGIGAVIGGLSGKTKSTQTVNVVELRLVINNTEYPVHSVKSWNCEGERILSKHATDEAYRWHGLLEVLIHRADKNDRIKGQNGCDMTNTSIIGVSVADELNKLVKLKEQGVLSEDEYNVQKGRLLS